MKIIKGIYERILRTHESVTDYDYKVGDYYLQYDFSNNFIVNLYQITIDYDLTAEEDNGKSYDELIESGYSESDIIGFKKIASFPVDRAKKMTCTDLRNFIEIGK